MPANRNGPRYNHGHNAPNPPYRPRTAYNNAPMNAAHEYQAPSQGKEKAGGKALAERKSGGKEVRGKGSQQEVELKGMEEFAAAW